jgi:hypothetical protein
MAVITLTRTAIPTPGSAPKPGWSVGYEGHQIATYLELESGRLVLADWTALDRTLRGQGEDARGYAEFLDRDALLTCYLRGADWWEADGTRRVLASSVPLPLPQAGFGSRPRTVP